jgi:hypothetical protein
VSFGDRIKGWFSTHGPRPRDRYASNSVTVLSGLVLAVVGIGLFASIFELWPAVDRGQTAAETEIHASIFFGAYKASVTLSTGLILLAILAGALGAYIHTATSFVTYVGNRTLKASWLWWYALRLFIGAALALLLYFAFRGGIITGQDASEEINPYGIAAISGLAGLFSKQATDKLKEVFDVFFRTTEGGDATRSDKAEETRPVISRFEPGEIKVGELLELKILGQGFKSGASVLVDGQERSANFDSEQQLRIQLQTADTSTARSLLIKVKNPLPGEISEEKTLEVKA